MKTNQKQYENRQMAISTLTGIGEKNIFVRVCVWVPMRLCVHIKRKRPETCNQNQKKEEENLFSCLPVCLNSFFFRNKFLC